MSTTGQDCVVGAAKALVSQVESEMNEAIDNVGRLVEIVGQLEERLASVIDNPVEPEKTCDLKEGLVSLAHRMCVGNQTIKCVNQRLVSLLQRIEL